MTDPLFDLTGRVAVVTGGMGQLGQVYVSGLVERGMRVAVLDVAPGDLPEGARAFAVDITDRVAIEAAEREIEAEWGVPHLLVNNAALDSPPDAPVAEVGPFEDFPESSFDAVMDVNVKGTLISCQVVGGAMARERRGSIVNGRASATGVPPYPPSPKDLAPPSMSSPPPRRSTKSAITSRTEVNPLGYRGRQRPRTHYR